MSGDLALVSTPGHDWPWVTCGYCDGRISREMSGATYYDPSEYEECSCAGTDHPGIEPWPEEDPTVALLPAGAFMGHNVLWNEYPHALYMPGDVSVDAPF